jgi:mono/diheme cytochrome c family protein
MSRTSSKADKAFAASSPADPGLMSDEQLQARHEQLLHEKEEPSEGFSLLPIFLIFLLAGLIFWSGLYVLNHAAAFQWNIYDDNWRAGAGEAEDPAVAKMKRGATIFQAQCKSCHGAEGQGQPGLYPPLAGSPWPIGDPRRPISIVYEGMTGTVNVLGNVVNGSMPNVGHTMKPADLAAVLTYVRASFGNNDIPVEDAEVSDVENDIGNRGAWSPDEILAKYPLGLPDPNAAAAPAPAAPGGTAGTAPAAGTAPMAGTAAAAGTAK